MNRLRITTLALTAALATGAAVLAWKAWQTDDDIQRLRTALAERAATAAPPPWRPEALTTLPEPVQRWARYTFRQPPAPAAWVHWTMQGQFRRPLTEGFAPTTARQIAATGVPGMVFDATTPVMVVGWARAYDAFIDGHMTMRASLLSAVTVVNETSTPALDQTSLRRWLIESAMYPMALLPGGPVRWEAVDAAHARAHVQLGQVKASLLASFGEDGRLQRLDAEQGGDLETPYHGSGEQVIRDDDRLVAGMMLPHRFRFSRVGADGLARPFWEGRVTALRFGQAGEAAP